MGQQMQEVIDNLEREIADTMKTHELYYDDTK